MDVRDVSVATMTLVRDEDEERLLRETLHRLSLEPMKVALSDGGSRPEFVDFLRAQQSFTIVPPDGGGLAGQVKASLRTAADWPSPFILYTEPDKHLFFEQALAGFISAAPADNDVGVVLASRDERSFATFPTFQQHTEGAFNTLCADIIGSRGDYCYGPFLLNRALVSHLARLNREVGWGWRPFLFATARRLGYRVLHHVGDFACPDHQRQDDPGERIHRLRQLSQNIEGLVLSQQ